MNDKNSDRGYRYQEQTIHEDGMKIILRKEHENLGREGEVITVKNGFARNFLIPQGIAVLATEKNMRILAEENKIREIRKNKDRKNAEMLAKEMENVSLTISVPVGEEDRVFGSVTAQMIADKLKEKGHEIDRKKILLKEPIKALGIYNVSLKLHTDVEAGIRIWVVKE